MFSPTIQASIPIFTNGSFRASGLPHEFQSRGQELFSDNVGDLDAHAPDEHAAFHLPDVDEANPTEDLGAPEAEEHTGYSKNDDAGDDGHSVDTPSKALLGSEIKQTPDLADVIDSEKTKDSMINDEPNSDDTATTLPQNPSADEKPYSDDKVTDIDPFWTAQFHDFPSPKTPVDHYFSKTFWKKSFDHFYPTNDKQNVPTSHIDNTSLTLWNSFNDIFLSPNDYLHIDSTRLPAQINTTSFWKAAAAIAYEFFIPQVNHSSHTTDTFMSDSWFHDTQFDRIEKSNGNLYLALFACACLTITIVSVLYVQRKKRSLTRIGEMFSV